MSELISILEGAGLAVLVVIALAILIPTTFYLHKKRTTSNLYRGIEATILYGLFVWWAHGWTDWGDMLSVFWMVVIFCFVFLHIMLIANPLTEEKGRSKPKRRKK